jgi:antitoxin component YwqK of YwqJK toxin-antitoxin module
MNKYNEKGEKHGPWEEYHSNGNLMYKENYVNGELHGLSESYYIDGKLWYKRYYI